MNQFMTYLFAALIGFSADRRNVRLLLLFGTICTVAGLTGTAIVPSYFGVLISYGFVLAAGFGTIYVTIYAAIARWFYRRRGFAMSIQSVGFGMGALIGPPIVDTLLVYVSWDSVFLLFVVPVGGLFGLAAILFRDDPSAIGAHPDGSESSPPSDELTTGLKEQLTVREALESRQFWLLSVGFLLSSYGFYALIVHFVPYATSLGVSGTIAAGALGMIGGASIPARFGAGFVSDYFGRLPIIIVSILFMAVALFAIVIFSSPLFLTGMIILFGVGFGGQNGLYSPLIADVFAVSNVGRMVGLTSIAFAISGAAGPAVSSLLLEFTGAYIVPFVLAGVFAIIGAGLIAVSASADARKRL
jgi:MFS family permease